MAASAKAAMRLDEPPAQLDQMIHQRRFGRLDRLLFVLASHPACLIRVAPVLRAWRSVGRLRHDRSRWRPPQRPLRANSRAAPARQRQAPIARPPREQRGRDRRGHGFGDRGLGRRRLACGRHQRLFQRGLNVLTGRLNVGAHVLERIVAFDVVGDVVDLLLEVGHLRFAHRFLKLALEVGGHAAHACASTVRACAGPPGNSFGPMTISATTPISRNSVQEISNMETSRPAQPPNRCRPPALCRLGPAVSESDVRKPCFRRAA